MDDRRVAVVVEDDEDIRELMVALLGQSGFEVHAAATGADGVDAVKENDPVLVTVDLGLPDIDGYEVTRRVRRFTDAYVMMLTARSEEIDTLLGLDAGADDYLTKPFRPREVRARVEAMMRRPRAGRTGAGERGGHEAPTPSGTVDGAGTGASAGRVQGAGSGAVPASGARSSAAPAPSGAAGPGGAAPSADAQVALDGLVLYPNVHHVQADGRDVALTPTEFMLLETLLRSGRVVRSKAELSRILRGDEADAGTFVSEADERTVEVHVGNMRRKLGDDPRRPRWIETVRGIGYRAAGAATVTG